jgi:hypothetical protein
LPRLYILLSRKAAKVSDQKLFTNGGSHSNSNAASGRDFSTKSKAYLRNKHVTAMVYIVLLRCRHFRHPWRSEAEMQIMQEQLSANVAATLYSLFSQSRQDI